MLQYFNQGMMAIVALAYLNMFTSQYKLEPAEMQYLSSMIMLPWSPKLVYGIFIDTFPIFGSRKRNYLIVMSLIMTISSLLVASIKFDSASTVAILLTLMGFAIAVMDVVIDGLMICQSRKDADYGSEDLNTLGWGMTGLGGIIGSLAGGFIN